MAGFVRALSATWRRFLLRVTLVFIALAIAWWWVLAPPYAQLLMVLARPFTPALERAAETTYSVDGATVWMRRSFFDPATQQRAVFENAAWKGQASYDLILLAALILVTPGWSLRQRARLLGLGMVLITVTEFAFFLSTIEFAQLRPMTSRAGSLLMPAGFSRAKQVIFAWIYYFFQTMGRGLFPLLIYWGMIGLAWGQPDTRGRERSVTEGPGRNAPCPCGSGKKYKHCCGKA